VKIFKIATVSAAALALTLTGVCSPASAAIPIPPIPERQTVVLVGGSYISGDAGCTVGAVLRSTAFIRQITPYQRAMRYIVTAGHCTHVGQMVNGSRGAHAIGRTLSVSHSDDVALIQIFPLSVPSCQWVHHGFGSGGGTPTCVPTTTYRPRAIGRVFMTSRRTRSEEQIPMVGPGTPAAGAPLCTTGMKTGVNCSFDPVPVPPAWIDHMPRSKTATTDGANVVVGDSGSPITNSDGTFFGIQTGTGAEGGYFANFMVWTPASEIFRDFPNYALAAPN